VTDPEQLCKKTGIVCYSTAIIKAFLIVDGLRKHMNNRQFLDKNLCQWKIFVSTPTNQSNNPFSLQKFRAQSVLACFGASSLAPGRGSVLLKLLFIETSICQSKVQV